MVLCWKVLLLFYIMFFYGYLLNTYAKTNLNPDIFLDYLISEQVNNNVILFKINLDQLHIRHSMPSEFKKGSLAKEAARNIRSVDLNEAL